MNYIERKRRVYNSLIETVHRFPCHQKTFSLHPSLNTTCKELSYQLRPWLINTALLQRHLGIMKKQRKYSQSLHDLEHSPISQSTELNSIRHYQ